MADLSAALEALSASMINASARRVQKRGLDLGATRPVLEPDQILVLLAESPVATRNLTLNIATFTWTGQLSFAIGSEPWAG